MKNHTHTHTHYHNHVHDHEKRNYSLRALWEWLRTRPLQRFAIAMGVLASISIGIVACVAFYTVLGWGGMPFAIITGIAAILTEGVVYLQEMPEEFHKYYQQGVTRDLKNSYIAEYLLKHDVQKNGKANIASVLENEINRIKALENPNDAASAHELTAEENQILAWVNKELEDRNSFKMEAQKFDHLLEPAKKKIMKKILILGMQERQQKEMDSHQEKVFFEKIFSSDLEKFYEKITDAETLLLNDNKDECVKSFRRKKILFYISILFSVASGVCFGLIGFYNYTTASFFLFGFTAATNPWWIIALATLIAFAAAFTYTMLMVRALNKLFNGGFATLWEALLEFFVHPHPQASCSDKMWHFAEGLVKFVLLVGVVVAVLLVGLASGGTLLEACTDIFVNMAQVAAPLVISVANIAAWVFWIPLMLLFLLTNAWLSIRAIWTGLKQLWRSFIRFCKNPKKAQSVSDFFSKMTLRNKVILPFYLLGCLLASFFLVLHLVSEGALSGEGMIGEANFFSNVFTYASNFIDSAFQVTIDSVLFIVITSTLVELLEDLPYFSDEPGEAHDHGSFVENIFARMGGLFYDLFAQNGLYKLAAVVGACAGMELLVTGAVAWGMQTTVLGVSASIAPSICLFGVIVVTAVAFGVYFLLPASQHKPELIYPELEVVSDRRGLNTFQPQNRHPVLSCHPVLSRHSLLSRHPVLSCHPAEGRGLVYEEQNIVPLQTPQQVRGDNI